jgi:site-specific recombinase XerD
MIARAAFATDLGSKAHAHMLRRAGGYKLAKDGVDARALQAYLGHRNIQNTTRYTALAPDRIQRFWPDLALHRLWGVRRQDFVHRLARCECVSGQRSH